MPSGEEWAAGHHNVVHGTRAVSQKLRGRTRARVSACPNVVEGGAPQRVMFQTRAMESPVDVQKRVFEELVLTEWIGCDVGGA